MANSKRDYYEILGVSRDSSPEDIKEAFRNLTLKFHPDRNKAPDAEEKFKEIAEAYAVLSNPQKRSEYNVRGFAGVAGYTPEDLFSGIDFGDIFSDVGFGFDRESMFERFFHPRARRPRRGRDMQVGLTVPLECIASGGEEPVHIQRPMICTVCNGSGVAAGSTISECSECKGSGRKIIKQRREKGVSFQEIITCPFCHGKGKIIEELCHECGGRGEVLRDDVLTVTIPVGAEEGMSLRIPGHGFPSSFRGAAPGDLYIIVSTAPDPRFERRGADLWRVERIKLVDAVLGITLSVPSLKGSLKVKVPAGSQPNDVLKLDNQGLPFYGGAGRGNLNIRLAVQIPEKLSSQERKLYEQLQSLKRKD